MLDNLATGLVQDILGTVNGSKKDQNALEVVQESMKQPSKVMMSSD